MKIIDFNRTFFFFELDLVAKPPKTVSDPRQNRHNRARIRIDCHCHITGPTGKSTSYYLGESCKTERVGCSRRMGLFIKPNADFRPVYSTLDLVVFKSWDRNNRCIMLTPPRLGPQPEKQVINTEEAFYRHQLLLRHASAAELKCTSAIIAACDAGRAMVARTEYRRAGFGVLLEYPIFTLNISRRHQFYQTDTGPVIYPELKKDTRRVGSTLNLAYVAFNSARWAEFIIQKPTPIGKGLSVNHYSQVAQVDCKNTIFALT
jgi:hypothetical protein